MPTIPKAGELDPTFASRGRFWHDQYNHAGPMALLTSTGHILLSSAHRTEQCIKLLRLDAGGAPDRAFGTDGVATVEYTGALRVFLSMIVTDETEGIYVVGDYNYAPNSFCPIVFHVLPTGKPNTHFGEHGQAYRVYRSISSLRQDRLLKSTPASKYRSSNVQQSASGSIRDGVLYFHSRDHIVAITLNGDLATDFNGTGFWRAAYEGQPVLLGAVAVTEHGIYAAHAPLPNENYHSNVTVTRLDNRANVDVTFAARGHLYLSTPGHTLLAARLEQSTSNAYFVLACRTDINTYDEGSALMSFKCDGMPNTHFNAGKPVILQKNPLVTASALDLAFEGQPGDHERIYLTVLYEDEAVRDPFALLRFNGDGALDDEFGDAGWAFVGESGTALEVNCQSNGQPLVTCNLKLATDPRSGIYLVRLTR
ncbi:hypothetical protein [Pseudomonas fulva]|uniref:hypothetical protein n=1 Tax=Pseudomonas fulva TaxID=47880 RepID=UPI0018A8F1C6|nr:hypothetical protein [Pseudomonas fulva]MBF8774200.1 hypothetical protein [Pseudomonas fulva]